MNSAISKPVYLSSVSGKGGVGKSTASVNPAIARAAAGCQAGLSVAIEPIDREAPAPGIYAEGTACGWMHRELAAQVPALAGKASAAG